jgi:hypothetical protein
MFVKQKVVVPVSLAQLVRTMHNICKVRGSNPGHQKKKKGGWDEAHVEELVKVFPSYGQKDNVGLMLTRNRSPFRTVRIVVVLSS